MEKLIKGISIILVMVLLTNLTIPTNEKISKAAEYTSATVLPMTGSWGEELYLTESSGSEQWYKVIIPSDGNFNMKIMKYWSERLNWSLKNEDLSIEVGDDYILGGTLSSPVTASYDIPISAGTYYLRIWLKSYDDGGKYKMCNTFTSYNVNDTSAESYDSPQIYEIGDTITGCLAVTDTEDWFRITVPKEINLKIKISECLGSDSLNWSIKNSDLSEELYSDYLRGGTETTPKTAEWDIKLAEGIYYLRFDSGWIYGHDGGKYSFYLEEINQLNCNHEWEKTSVYATYFKKGYTLYSCVKCGYFLKDDYTSKKVLSKGYLYSSSYTGKGKLFLRWSTDSAASGYKIRYSRKRNMKRSSVKKIRGSSKSKMTIRGLSRRTKYYVQVRAYKSSGGETVYGKWSRKYRFQTK